jgi:phage gpG-like protein
VSSFLQQFARPFMTLDKDNLQHLADRAIAWLKRSLG